MPSTQRYLCSLLVVAALAAPVAIMATPATKDDGVQVKFYDSRHKDYHNWDDRENRSWGVYLSDNHKKSHEFSRASKREKSNYWNWRHAHPDHD
jgi:hypothetical protein